MHYLGKTSTRCVALASAVILLGGLAGCDKSESSASLLAQAKQLQAKGDNKGAIIQLKNAVLKNPADPQARLLLGDLYIATGDAASAEKELRKAQSLGASADTVLPPLAMALVALQQFQKAIDETDAASGGKDPRLLTARGDALLALDKVDPAKAAFDTALAAAPGHIGALIGEARVALARKDLAGAVVIADDAVAKYPNSVEAWQFKGNLMRIANKPDDALAAYDKVLALNPLSRDAQIEKASVHIVTGQLDAAKGDIEAARKLAPDNANVIYTQALLDFTAGKYPLALESLQKVLRVAPDHMPSILMAGAAELQVGSYAQAEQHLKLYLEKQPRQIFARKLMAATLLKLGRGVEAMAALAPALAEAGDKDAQLLALAGQISLHNGDFAKASAYYQQASTLAPAVADVHTGLAMSRLAQGDSERAVSEFELSSKLDVGGIKNGMLLVLTEMRLKRFDKALVAVSALAAAQPNDAAIANLKGGVYLGMADLARARASFMQALTLQPGYFPATANLAQMALRDKQPDVAKKLYLAVLDKDKKHIDALTALAALAEAQGQPAEALQWLEKAQAENPEVVAPALMLGRQYLNAGAKQKALTLARKLVVANPGDFDVLDLLGQAQMANGDAPGALDTFSKLAGQAPRSALAQLRLAGVHIVLENDQAAAADLKKALTLQPDMLDAQVALVDLFMRNKQSEAALAVARAIQTQRPKESVGLIIEGDLQNTLGKPALALALYERAFALHQTPALLVKLGGALRANGRAKEADLRLAQWLKDNPSDRIVGVYVAEGQLVAGQNPAATATLEGVLKFHPDDVIALNNLAWLYQQSKDARALPTAERAGKLAGDNPAILDTLGWILCEQGDSARALPILQKAVAGAPNSPGVRFHLGSALAKSGDKAGARRELEKVLANNKNYPKLDDVRALLRQL